MAERPITTLIYPEHRFEPSELLTFIECAGFVDDLYEMGLGEDELYLLQIPIMADPKHSRLLRGTGGLREGRYRLSSWGEKKCFYVRYVDFRDLGAIVLVAITDTPPPVLSKSHRNSVRKFISEQRDGLENRTIRFPRRS